MTEDLPTEQSLLFLTIRLGRLVKHRLHQTTGEEDQRWIGPHMGILRDLTERDGVRQQDLAVSSLKDKATITRALRALEENGLVARHPDPLDGRSKRIYITTEGKALCKRVIPKGFDIVREATKGLAPEEVQKCLKVMRHMYEKLQ